MILHSLRRELRAAGISLVELASRLDISHATVKRWMAGGSLSLNQLDDILATTGIEWAQVIAPAANDDHLLDVLAWDQEKALVAERDLLLVALAVMNHLGVPDILELYRISETDCVRHLMTLDRMGFLKLHAKNRVRLQVSRTFSWIREGPIQQWFREQSVDFFSGSFSGPGETLQLSSSMLTRESALQLRRLARQLTSEMTRLHHLDARSPLAHRHLVTLLVAARSWEPAALRELRRPAASPLPVVVRSGKKRPG